jgi:hypothetical protein
VESASLVAVTVSVPGLDGAVYTPPALMVPNAAFQVTDLLAAVPEIAEANCKVPPGVVEVDAGETATEFTTGVGAETVTVAEADWVGSATLVALTVSVPAVDGAV